jgi:hypothetical protein
MMVPRYHNVAGMPRQNYYLASLIFVAGDPDFGRPPHGIAIVSEKNSRHFPRGTLKCCKPEEFALVDPELALKQPRQHHPNERPSRFWEGYERYIGV